ncbi:BatD protein [Tenacibaculum sp. SG-28]|nr:BatD protein [Tenacibaculum sp. SG-28]
MHFYFFFILSCFSLLTYAQENELKASVSKNKLGINQRFRIQFTINKQGGDNFKAPNFKNVSVIGGPSQSISQSWINGKQTFSQSYTYILQPKRKGEITIGPATIEMEGKILTSNTVKILVLDAVEIPKNPNDPDYIASQNIHLVAEISKGQPYVGEGVYVEYRLYVSENISIYENGITESPQYNGFWNQELNNQGASVKQGTYNGEKYRYAVLHKALLIPTKSGKLTIDPMKMDIIVGVPTGRSDFFGNMVERRVRKEFSSAKKVIKARELPTANKPIDFSGAVGQFSFAVGLDKDALKANESSQISVTVSGKGNLKLFELPKIETPKELEVYQPERKEKVNISYGGISGTISDNYTVVPEFKGKYKIPAVTFSYFDPKEEKYKTITSEDVYVDVLEGKEITESTNTTDTVIKKKDIEVKGTNFRYIQTDSSLGPLETDDFYKSTWYFVLLLLPVVIVPIVVFTHRKKEERNKDILGNKRRKADRLAKKYLSVAAKQLGDKERFYESLERAMHNYLKAKLRVETADISKDKIKAMLENKAISETSITELMEVLNNCEFARYTPIDNLMMRQELEKAQKVITQLDKQL